MFWIDWIIISIVVFSAYIGLVRGFIKEILSLITWGAAYFIASHFYITLAIHFTSFRDELIKKIVAIMILFISTLFTGAVINQIISTFIKRTELKKTDCLLGLFFGFLRGLLIISVSIFFLDTFTTMEHSLSWEKSKIIPQFIHMIRWLLENIQSRYSLIQEYSPYIARI